MKILVNFFPVDDSEFFLPLHDYWPVEKTEKRRRKKSAVD